MRIAVAVLVAMMLSSCGHFVGMGHAGAVVSGGSGIEKSAYFSESQALEYARAELQKLVPQYSL